jgi:hypothetical protein
MPSGHKSHRPFMSIQARHPFAIDVVKERSFVLRMGLLGQGQGFLRRIRDEQLPARDANTLAQVARADFPRMGLKPGHIAGKALAPSACLREGSRIGHFFQGQGRWLGRHEGILRLFSGSTPCHRNANGSRKQSKHCAATCCTNALISAGRVRSACAMTPSFTCGLLQQVAGPKSLQQSSRLVLTDRVHYG